MMRTKYALPVLAATLFLLLGALFSSPVAPTLTPEAAFTAPAPASTVAPAQDALAAASKCYCTCTANDGDPSGGQVFEASNCGRLNGQGCLIGGENGTLSDCKRGPVPIDEVEPF